jgi:hypothetical protein
LLGTALAYWKPHFHCDPDKLASRIACRTRLLSIRHAILVPVSEVGSLAVGVGWLSACAAYLAHHGREDSTTMAWMGAAVSLSIVLMKIVPQAPGSFTGAEWTAFIGWSALGCCSGC